MHKIEAISIIRCRIDSLPIRESPAYHSICELDGEEIAEQCTYDDWVYLAVTDEEDNKTMGAAPRLRPDPAERT